PFATPSIPNRPRPNDEDDWRSGIALHSKKHPNLVPFKSPPNQVPRSDRLPAPYQQPLRSRHFIGADVKGQAHAKSPGSGGASPYLSPSHPHACPPPLLVFTGN